LVILGLTTGILGFGVMVVVVSVPEPELFCELLPVLSLELLSAVSSSAYF
jgi:hypothetical protein